VQECYPRIRDLFGPPFFNISVNFWKDSSSNYPGSYFASDNAIVLRDISVDTICHKIVHAFRDDAVIPSPVFAGYINPFLCYQLAGYAWAKVYLENRRFFQTFNQLYRDEVMRDPLVRFNLLHSCPVRSGA